VSIATPKSALIVAHGQPSDPQPPEIRLAALARQVATHLEGWELRSATIAAPGRLEKEVAALPPGSVLFPMFMADGWFVGRVLPKRLGDARVEILPPLGFDPDLPALAAGLVRTHLAGASWPEAGSTLLLAAHGSARGPRAAQSARAFADQLSTLMPGLAIVTGFVEEAPFVQDAARGLGPRAVCLPYFALEGDHCRKDIPEALEKAGFQGTTLPPLGETGAIPALIARALERSRAQPG